MDPIIEELQVRAQAVVAAPQKNYAEMGAVHRAITGTHYDCTPCNERRILFTLDLFITNPERYALRIKEAQIEMEEVKKSNYRFSKKATSQLIVLVSAFGTIKVTPENLTDEKAELVLQHRQFAHNIERIPGTELEEEEDTDPEGEGSGNGDSDPVTGLAPNGNLITLPPKEEPLTLEQAQQKYLELYKQAPGNRKLETLVAAIHKAEDSK
ncbi:hypothetical protein OB13_15030 [Pontibacter sp. HJ8]